MRINGNGNEIDKLTIIGDTSFFTNYAYGMLWALRVGYVMAHNNSSGLLVPQEVTREFKALTPERLIEDYGALHPFKSVEEIVESERISIYKAYFDREISERLDREVKEDIYPKKPKRLSFVDKKVMQAVEESLHECKNVAVATADKDIYVGASRLSDETKRDITIFSPWTGFVENDFYASIDTLISGQVFRDLYTINPSDNSRRYLAVVENLTIRGNLKYDLAVGIYTKKRPFDLLPALENTYFIPVAFVQLDENMRPIKYKNFIWNIISTPSFVLYDLNRPTLIDLVKHRSIPLNEAKRLEARVNNNEITGEDFMNRLNQCEFNPLNWTRIEDWHIGIFNKVSVGKLKSLRQKLGKS